MVTPRLAPRLDERGAARPTGVSETLQVAPRETVTWDVQTLDATGKGVPADVSLALVDKAVLTLATDQAGKILDRFYSQRGLGVQTGVTLVLNIDRLVAQLAEDGKGGGGGGGGGGARRSAANSPTSPSGGRRCRRMRTGKATVAGDPARQPDHLGDGRAGGHRGHAGRPVRARRSSRPRTCWCGRCCRASSSPATRPRSPPSSTTRREQRPGRHLRRERRRA